MYKFTYRQEQLAKLTPSELIELAYMSALMEQHPFGNFEPFSNRFRVLKKFLEEIGSVVPLESVLYAIASSDPEEAVVCCNMLQASKIQIPLSACALAGLSRALTRMKNDEIIPIVTAGLLHREVVEVGLLGDADLHIDERFCSTAQNDQTKDYSKSKTNLKKVAKKWHLDRKRNLTKTTGTMPVSALYKQCPIDYQLSMCVQMAALELDSSFLVAFGHNVGSESPQVSFLTMMHQ